MNALAQLAVVTIASGLIGFPLCLFLLWLYKRAVVRSMQHRAVAERKALVPSQKPIAESAAATTTRDGSELAFLLG